eukprot:scaffold12865_cov152-Skeletonema_menzelii.AAC.13
MAMRSRQQCFEERCRQKTTAFCFSEFAGNYNRESEAGQEKDPLCFFPSFLPARSTIRRRVHPFVGACLSHAFGRILEKEHSTAVRHLQTSVFICRPCSNRKYLCHASTSSIFCVVVIAEAKTIAS